ncbi:MAG: PD-(D/E)XK nuclease family protein [Candidatus Cloacimonetes bacterium]|nr:PD-(D/E)XK nuclease family protein [Candidatus Cloacimonadota bacterium]
MTETKPHSIRASSLPAYNDCPRRAIARLFRNDIENAGYKLRDIKPNIGAILGTSTHFYIEKYFQARIDKIEFQNPIDEVMSNLQDNIKEGVETDDTTPNIDVAKMQIERMAKAYIEGIGKFIEPVAVELNVSAEINDEWQVTGHIDLVCQGKTGVYIRDLKTGAVVRSHHAQLGAYSLLYRSEYPDIKVEGIAIDFVKRIPKTRSQETPKTTEYDVHLSEQTAYATINRIIRNFADFQKDTKNVNAFAENPMSLLCSERFCPAFSTAFCPITQEYNKNHIKE